MTSNRKIRWKRYLWAFVLFIIALYLLGPQPPRPELSKDLPSMPSSIRTMDESINNRESHLTIRPDNQSRIVWANDSLKERTEYALLYLHGFSASWYEGYPVHTEFAKYFGMNLYLPRLASHGLITEEPLIDMTPDNLWESAKEALMIARSLGKKVIIMSTSTGGSLALKLAADYPEYVDGLLLFSPNIRINNNLAFLLSKPWGLQLARSIYHGKYKITDDDPASKDCQYWYCKYRLEGVVLLQQLIDATMKKETFNRVTAPVFLGYFYKDKEHQDPTVKVSAMRQMFKQLGTASDRKSEKAFPEAAAHVIGCELTSQAVDEVLTESINFGVTILGLKPLSAKPD